MCIATALPIPVLAAGGPSFIDGTSLALLWLLPAAGWLLSGMFMCAFDKARAWGAVFWWLAGLMGLLCLTDVGLIAVLFLGPWVIFVGTLLFGVLPILLWDRSSSSPVLLDRQYTDGTEILLGDRVSVVDEDNALGTIAAVVGKGQWGAGYSEKNFTKVQQGFLVELDDGRKFFYEKSIRAVQFIARGGPRDACEGMVSGVDGECDRDVRQPSGDGALRLPSR